MTERRLTMEFQTAVHHGSGFGIAGLVDRAFLRDGSGMPYLSGSAIKGRFRHAALRIVLARGESACQYGDQKRICREPACALCQMFGSPIRAGRLSFLDAYPGDDLRPVFATLAADSRGAATHGDSTVRAATAINRGRRTTREGHLFSTEVLPDYVSFEGKIMGSLDATEEEILGQAALILTHFGADAARGLGRCDFRIERLA